jgi:hypothetical protein
MANYIGCVTALNGLFLCLPLGSLVVPSADLLDDILNFPTRRIYQEILALDEKCISDGMFNWFPTTFMPSIFLKFLKTQWVSTLETILRH